MASLEADLRLVVPTQRRHKPRDDLQQRVNYLQLIFGKEYRHVAVRANRQIATYNVIRSRVRRFWLLLEVADSSEVISPTDRIKFGGKLCVGRGQVLDLFIQPAI